MSVCKRKRKPAEVVVAAALSGCFVGKQGFFVADYLLNLSRINNVQSWWKVSSRRSEMRISVG
jgi:hypothetical protein